MQMPSWKVGSPSKYTLLQLISALSLLILLSCTDNNYKVKSLKGGQEEFEQINIKEKDTITNPKEDPLFSYSMDEDFFPKSQCHSFFYNDTVEVFIGLVGDEAIWYSEDVIYRYRYQKVAQIINLIDIKDNTVGDFNEKSGILHDHFSDQKVYLKPCRSFDESNKILPLRLLTIEPYLSWYDGVFQFSICSQDNQVLNAFDVQPIVSYIANQSAKYLSPTLRLEWYYEWDCAFKEDPKGIVDWLKDIRIDLIAKILYTRTPQAAHEMDSTIYKKMNEVLKEYPNCLIHIKQFLEQYVNHN